MQLGNRGDPVDLVVDMVELCAKVTLRRAGDIFMLYLRGVLELTRCKEMRGDGERVNRRRTTLLRPRLTAEISSINMFNSDFVCSNLVFWLSSLSTSEVWDV